MNEFKNIISKGFDVEKFKTTLESCMINYLQFPEKEEEMIEKVAQEMVKLTKDYPDYQGDITIIALDVLSEYTSQGKGLSDTNSKIRNFLKKIPLKSKNLGFDTTKASGGKLKLINTRNAEEYEQYMEYLVTIRAILKNIAKSNLIGHLTPEDLVTLKNIMLKHRGEIINIKRTEEGFELID